MISALIAILIIVLIGALIAGLIQYAPFIQPPLKQWVLFAIGAIIAVMVILQLVPLLNTAAVVT